MKTFILLFAALSVQGAFAHSIVFPAGSMTPGNLLSKFQISCSDENAKSTQCQAWAAILKNESKSLLLKLQDSRHPDNIAIFEEAATLDDSGIKTMALEYLSGVKDRNDPGLLASALDAMFTEDSFLGNIAAKILRGTNSAPHEEVGKQFSEGRNTQLFDDPTQLSELLTNELWLQTDDSYQALYPVNQEHFIALDRYYYGQGSKDIGGRGFLIASPVTDVIAYFKSKTGLTPALSLNEIEIRLKPINDELVKIADQMQHGDYSQMQRMIQIQQDMQVLSAQQMQWYQMGIFSESMKSATAFFFTSPQDQTVVTGAILVRDWPIYQKTSIQYLNQR